MNSHCKAIQLFIDLNFRNLVFGTGLLLAASSVLAQPVGYYDTVNKSSSQAMRDSLHEIIDDHQRFPYTSTATDTWDILEIADEDQDNENNIITIYRNASYAKQGGGNDSYNREHTWPNSYGFPKDNASNYPYTDAHALYLADDGYNSSRSNHPYNYCNAGCSEKVTETNNGRGGMGGSYPGDSNWREGSNTNGVWEVWRGRRGDAARALMYLDVRYEGGVHDVTGISEPDLILTNNLQLIEGSKTGNNESVAYMGMLAALLEWHKQDPVDWIEFQHHEAVASFQGNRNPFIDHPEWATCVFEGECINFRINSGLNDAWFNPATPGQGFFVTVFPQIGQVFLAWFTYDAERPDESVTANIGEPGHRWLTAFGAYANNKAVLDIEITQGGIFDASNPIPSQNLDGTITLEFSDCNTGTVTYDIPSIGRQGVIPILRIALDNVPACEELDGLAWTDPPAAITTENRTDNRLEADGFQINRGLNDAWYNPITAGQGFFINVFPDIGQMFLAWFTYDTERPDGSVAAGLGDPGHRWITAYGPYTDHLAVLDIEITEGGVFDAAAPAPTQYADGTMTVDVTDCENGTISYDITSANLQGQIPIQRIALDNVPLCESLEAQSQQNR